MHREGSQRILRMAKLHCQIHFLPDFYLWTNLQITEERSSSQIEWWMPSCLWQDQGIFIRTSHPDDSSWRKTSDYVFDCIREFNEVCVGPTWRVWPKRACNILPEQKVYRLWNQIFTARENLLCSGMSCSPSKTIYVNSYHSIDFKDGSNQVYLREACLVRKNSKMADDLDWVWHKIYDPKGN